MKKTILFLFVGVLSAGVAGAEELVIQLKSGNSITIQYTGAIQGVTWNGTTDGIAGLSMPTPAQAGTALGQTKAAPPSAAAEGKKADGSGIRFRWAEPQRED